MSILTTLAMMGGATFAYFSSQGTSENNTFSTGTLEIAVNQNGQTDLNEQTTGVQVAQDWKPGDTTDVLFNVYNSGTLPVNLKGFALGNWNDAGLDVNKVKATKVEYKLNGSGNWATLVPENLSGLTGAFYYSPDGTNSNLTALASHDTLNLKITVLFDSTANNSYEGKIYTAHLNVDAIQTNASF